jgi:hypothetical protein
MGDAAAPAAVLAVLVRRDTSLPCLPGPDDSLQLLLPPQAPCVLRGVCTAVLPLAARSRVAWITAGLMPAGHHTRLACHSTARQAAGKQQNMSIRAHAVCDMTTLLQVCFIC